MESNKLIERIEKLERAYQKIGNFQAYTDKANFITSLQVPVYVSLPSTKRQGQVCIVANKFYIVGTSGNWTAIN